MLSLVACTLKLAAQGHKFYRSPFRFAQLAWGFSNNISRQIKIFRIVSNPLYIELIRSDAILPFKYLTKDYLARGLTTVERAACFGHHYERLTSLFPSDLLQRIMHGPVTVFELSHGGHRYSIRLSRSRTEVREGELSLWLDVDGLLVFILQFTIVPGEVVRSNAEDIFLISRLQGMPGCYQEIYRATKAFHEIAPPALLIAALQGISRACPGAELAGVSATSQFSYAKHCSPTFRAAYDEFWTELGAEQMTDKFFKTPIPLREKSLDMIKNGHKARTRKKRAFKRHIADEVFRSLFGSLELVPAPCDPVLCQILAKSA
jgi:uncharacterized protein